MYSKYPIYLDVKYDLPFQYVGLFMLGFHSGLFLGLIGLCAADLSGEEILRPASPWAAVGVLILAGLVMALLNLL